MKTEDINKIYDRLLEIKVEIDPEPSPDPRQINTKIAQVHIFIDEIEKNYIRVSKEISLRQRALNDQTASYESQKEGILSDNPEVKELPSIKDREAKANQILKDERKAIQEYQNELNDLNNLLRAINLKLKNLNRTNGDIKNQIRVMEAQIRLGMPPIMDEGARTLQQELGRSLLNQDSFKDATTNSDENSIVDPSAPLDMDSLLNTGDTDEDGEESGDDTDEENIPENMLDPLQDHGILDELEPVDLDAEIIQEAQQSISEEKPKMNLDDLLDGKQTETEIEGGDEKKQENTQSGKVGEIKPDESQKSDSINIDDLLSQFS